MATDPQFGERENNAPTVEMLNRLFDRGVEDFIRRREAEQREKEWPRDVEQLLAALVEQAATYGARIAALEARLGERPA
jgi:hypothetical protein